jgi:hypothetical protein
MNGPRPLKHPKGARLMLTTEGVQNGFSMQFDNGWRVSVQFGTFHWCSNRDLACHVTTAPANPDQPKQCANAEVAVIDPDGSMEASDGRDMIFTFQSPEDVAEILSKVSKINPDFRLATDWQACLRSKFVKFHSGE